jgi:hypothetical protein
VSPPSPLSANQKPSLEGLPAQLTRVALWLSPAVANSVEPVPPPAPPL